MQGVNSGVEEPETGATDTKETAVLPFLSLVSLGGLKRLGLEVARGTWRDDCLGLAAEFAYFGLFSLFPFLLFLRALVPYTPGADVLVSRGLEALDTLISPDSRLYQVVADNVLFEVMTRNQVLLSVGAVLTLWSASSVFGVLVKALNRAYNLTETRGWFRRRVVAVLLTVLMMLFVPAGLALLLIGPWLGDLLGRYIGSEREFAMVWGFVRWPLVFGLLATALALLYYFAPNARQRWHWLTVGSLVAVAAIVVETMVLSWALSSRLFAPEWLTYGAIGAAIIVLFWLYLIGFSILVGAEVNAALERLTGRLTQR